MFASGILALKKLKSNLNFSHCIKYRFLLDSVVSMFYSGGMLSGIRIFSDDEYWIQILSELGATVVPSPNMADVNMADLEIDFPVPPMELKSSIISAMDNTKILAAVFGKPVHLSDIQTDIVVRLYKTGGMTANDLKIAMGYAVDADTHTVETAIYGLRKLFGHDFIKNSNGVFCLGGL